MKEKEEKNENESEEIPAAAKSRWAEVKLLKKIIDNLREAESKKEEKEDKEEKEKTKKEKA